MELNELPLVDASSTVDCVTASAGGVVCAHDGNIVERCASGDTVMEVARNKKDRVKCMVLVPGKELRLWVGMNSGYVVVYAVGSDEGRDAFGAVRAEKLAHSGPVSCIISHGRRVYTGSGDKCIFEWHAATMELLRSLPSQRGAVRAVAAIGLVLFTSDSTDHTVRCWNLNTCEPAGKLVGHKAIIRSIMYHLLSGTLWTGGEDGSIIVWNVGEQRQLTTLHTHTHVVTSLAQTSSGFTISAGQDSIMCVYTTHTPERPVCIKQLSIPHITTILPISEEDGRCELWIARKRLGSKLFELCGTSPTSSELASDAAPPPAAPRDGARVRRPPAPAAAAAAGSGVRGRSPAGPPRRRGASPSPAARRRTSPSPALASRQDTLRSRGSAAESAGSSLGVDERRVLLEEAKQLRRELLQVQTEATRERKSFEAQLVLASERETHMSNTLYQATNNVADMTGMVKRLMTMRPELRPELRPMMQCVADTHKIIRDMGPPGGAHRRRSPSPSPGYCRVAGKPKKTSRRSPSPIAMPRYMRDTAAIKRDPVILVSDDGRMPMKRGAWDNTTKPTSRPAAHHQPQRTAKDLERYDVASEPPFPPPALPVARPELRYGTPQTPPSRSSPNKPSAAAAAVETDSETPEEREKEAAAATRASARGGGAAGAAYDDDDDDDSSQPATEPSPPSQRRRTPPPRNPWDRDAADSPNAASHGAGVTSPKSPKPPVSPRMPSFEDAVAAPVKKAPGSNGSPEPSVPSPSPSPSPTAKKARPPWESGLAGICHYDPGSRTESDDGDAEQDMSASGGGGGEGVARRGAGASSEPDADDPLEMSDASWEAKKHLPGASFGKPLPPNPDDPDSPRRMAFFGPRPMSWRDKEAPVFTSDHCDDEGFKTMLEDSTTPRDSVVVLDRFKSSQEIKKLSNSYRTLSPGTPCL